MYLFTSVLSWINSPSTTCLDLLWRFFVLSFQQRVSSPLCQRQQQLRSRSSPSKWSLCDFHSYHSESDVSELWMEGNVMFNMATPMKKIPPPVKISNRHSIKTDDSLGSFQGSALLFSNYFVSLLDFCIRLIVSTVAILPTSLYTVFIFKCAGYANWSSHVSYFPALG